MISPFTLLTPSENNRIPLVFDSPHSGSHFPSDFISPVSKKQLMTGWDAFIEDLWSGVVTQGGYLLHAHFSRMYIDPNRAPDDIDPSVVATPWDKCKPTKYSERGMGLIRQFALPGIKMYPAPLSITQIQARLNHWYLPYHDQLNNTLNELHDKFSGVWHIDCHSMKSVGNKMNIDAGAPRPDIILGDNDGTTASDEFVSVVHDTFVSLGYSVVRNKPYKGGYVVNHYADVSRNRHSMQIEINRRLYMDEVALKRNDNFDKFKADLAAVSQAVANYVSQQVSVTN